MTTNRSRHRRRTTTLTLTVAALALTTGLLTACDPTDTSDASDSLSCLKSWSTITDSLKSIHDTGVAAAEDPSDRSKSDKAIETLEKNVSKIGSGSDDSKVDKAVDDLDKAISDYNKSILNGDTHPDSSKIDAAADKLKDVCTS
ncbi:hypothetical protein ACIRU8_27965 [Streptomyces sp. NPDC101175]|uniref:hypothetical protein n=1 Tax=Streptomyces sp. NPDC101175 TaxID=3366123 RepID=UPI00383651CB